MDLHPLKRTAWILARGKAKKKMISPIKRYVGNNNKNCGNAKIGNLLDWTGVLKKKGEKKLSLPPCAQRPHLGNYNQEAVFFIVRTQSDSQCLAQYMHLFCQTVAWKALSPSTYTSKIQVKTPSKKKDKKTMLFSCRVKKRTNHAIHLLVCQLQLEAELEPNDYYMFFDDRQRVTRASGLLV